MNGEPKEIIFVKKLDVTALKEEERGEIAKLLFKCGYTISSRKERSGNKTKHLIVVRES